MQLVGSVVVEESNNGVHIVVCCEVATVNATVGGAIAGRADRIVRIAIAFVSLPIVIQHVLAALITGDVPISRGSALIDVLGISSSAVRGRVGDCNGRSDYGEEARISENFVRRQGVLELLTTAGILRIHGELAGAVAAITSQRIRHDVRTLRVPQEHDPTRAVVRIVMDLSAECFDASDDRILVIRGVGAVGGVLDDLVVGTGQAVDGLLRDVGEIATALRDVTATGAADDEELGAAEALFTALNGGGGNGEDRQGDRRQ